MDPDTILCRASPGDVALETTLLCHGVPRAYGLELASSLAQIIASEGAQAAVVGVVRGQSVVGMTDDELREMLATEDVPKVNLSNLGVALHRKQWGATTVGSTIALAAKAGLRVMATGGIGGMHQGYGVQVDISADLGAIARTPMAIVTSGCKSILDVVATRELLETLGIPVVGFGTDHFPAFYLRQSGATVDARFDDVADLAAYLDMELRRTGRGIVVAHPIPKEAEIARADWAQWLAEAEAIAVQQGAHGRDKTPALLAALHAVSGGETLRANLALVRANARLAAQLCHCWPAG